MIKSKADCPIGYFITIDEIPVDITTKHPELNRLKRTKNFSKLLDIGWVEPEVEDIELEVEKALSAWFTTLGFTYKDNIIISY